MNRAEICEFAPKVGVKVALETWEERPALLAYPEAVVGSIRDHHARGDKARSWQLAFLLRRMAWHMLDHAWELEDRDLTNGR